MGLTDNSTPDSKVHGANMEPTWVLSAPDGPHVGPVNLAIRNSIDNGLSLNSHQATIIWTNDGLGLWRIYA